MGLQRRRIRQRVAAGAKYLNLGSGPRGVQSVSWINIDGWPDKNVDFAVDLTRSLPFGDETFSGIFCEHVLEHFDIEQGNALLKECLRILKPGACVRLIVPDGETILTTYLKNPAELIAKRGMESPFAIDVVNSYFRQRYEHQYIYDWSMLQNEFVKLGFSDVRRVSYKEGVISQPIILDDEKYAWESLYVEASKPL